MNISRPPFPSDQRATLFPWPALCWVLALFLTGCTIPAPTLIEPTPPATATVQTTPPGEPIAVVTSLAGNVFWDAPTNSQPAPAGKRLSPLQTLPAGARLRAEAGSSATLVCFNNHVVTFVGPDEHELTTEFCDSGNPLPATASRQITPDDGRLKVNEGSLELEGEAREQEGDYGNLPIIVSPRNTALLELTPTVQWVAVKDAVEYVLSLSGPGSFDEITLEAERLSCNEDSRTDPYRICTAPWPDAWPLVQGKRYFLRVSARTGIASALRPSESPSSLRTLDAQTAAQLAAEVAALQALDLDPMTTNLLLAGLFAGQGVKTGDKRQAVYAQAIPLYEQVLRQQPSPMLYVTLGDGYRAVAWLRPAAKAYQNALDLLDQGNDDPAVRAAAEFGLGQVEYSRGQYALAEPHFVKAVELYMQTEAEEELQAAQKALGETQQRLPEGSSTVSTKF